MRIGDHLTMIELLDLTRNLQNKQIKARAEGRDMAVIDAIDHMFERACEAINIQASYWWATRWAGWWREEIDAMVEQMEGEGYVLGRKVLEHASQTLWEEYILM